MYRRITHSMTLALLLFAMLAGIPSDFAQAKSHKPDPSDTPSATATPSPSPAAPTPTPSPASAQNTPLAGAISGLSKIQTLIEFYYMNTGSYPLTLDELKNQYNDHAPKDGKKVTLPFDPATSKPFIYTSSEDGRSYTVRVPDPDAYGLKSLQLSNMDWGWMHSIADEHKRIQMTELCTLYIKGLANALDQYARDNKNQLPDSLDALVPKYVKKLPICPVCTKPYVYKKTARGYEVSCADPKSHELEVLEYSSSEGLKRR